MAASDEEVLREKRFDALEPGELARLYRLMTRLEIATPRRRTRRSERQRRGEHMDMRRTLRGSMRTAGDPIRLARRRRRVVRPPRMVMLCDISGSMEPYARAYLQFLTSAAGSGPNAEAFVFATRLTRLTRALRSRSPERAIQRAAAAAPDWSSGTRIGDALKAFNDRHGRRGMARGAVVVILSDGWERGDPALVGREMERLSRLAHRIVWVNPRVAATGFSPRAGGMAAALPYCDALVSGHSLEALGEVAEAIAAERWEPPAPAAEPVEEEPWASATPAAGQLGGDAERPWAEPRQDDTRLGARWRRVTRRARRASIRAASARRCPRMPLGGPQPSFCDLEEHNALTAHQERQRLERESGSLERRTRLRRLIRGRRGIPSGVPARAPNRQDGAQPDHRGRRQRGPLRASWWPMSSESRRST